ncbi:MAG: VOC family protein [Anaerolineae bacterium]
MSQHPIQHVEFSARDPMAAGRFYAELFGWELVYKAEWDYLTFKADPGPPGSFAQVDDSRTKAGDVVPYVYADDIDAILAKVQSLGGTVLQPRTEIPNKGWYAFFADPTGNRIGLFAYMPGCEGK